MLNAKYMNALNFTPPCIRPMVVCIDREAAEADVTSTASPATIMAGLLFDAT